MKLPVAKPILALAFILLPSVALADDYLPGTCEGPACDEVKLTRGENDGCYYAVNTGKNAATVRAAQNGMPLSHVVKPGEKVEIRVEAPPRIQRGYDKTLEEEVGIRLESHEIVASDCAKIESGDPFAYETDIVFDGECTGDACEDVKLSRGPDANCYYAYNTGEVLSSIELPDQGPQFLDPGEKAEFRSKGECVAIADNAKPAYVAKRQIATDWEIVEVDGKKYEYSRIRRVYRPRFDIRGSYEQHLNEYIAEFCTHPLLVQSEQEKRFGIRPCIIGDTPLQKKIRDLEFHICRHEVMWNVNQITLVMRDDIIRHLEGEIAKLRATPEDSPLRTVEECSRDQIPESVRQLRARMAKRSEPQQGEKEAESTAGQANADSGADVPAPAPDNKRSDEVASLGDPAGESDASATAVGVPHGSEEADTGPAKCSNKDAPELAIPGCTAVIEAGHGSPFAYFVRGRAYTRNGQFDVAARDFEEVFRGNPDDDIAYDTHILLATAYSQTDRNDRAFEELDAAIGMRPTAPDPYVRRGLLSRIAGRLDDALADFDTALHHESKHMAAHYYRGQTLKDKGDYAGAVEAYGAAIEIEPDGADAYNARAIAQIGLGNFEQALADFDKAFAIAPDNASIANNQKQVVDDLTTNCGGNDRAIAIASCSALIDTGRNTFANRFLRGKNYASDGQYDLAIADLGEVLGLNPDETTEFFTYYLRGQSHFRTKQFDLAVEDFDAAAAIRPEHADVYFQRSLVFREQAAFDRAVSDLDAAIRINPQHSAALFLRGNIRRQAGEFEAAVEDFSAALEVEPNAVVAYGERARALISLHRYEEALKDYDTALQIDEDNAQLKEARQALLRDIEAGKAGNSVQ